MAPGRKKWRLSNAAENDLADIWTYTAGLWSANQADHYHEDIMDEIEAIAHGSKIVRNIDFIRTGYRYRPCGSHNIFFREENDRIIVVRILHNRMDPARHL